MDQWTKFQRIFRSTKLVSKRSLSYGARQKRDSSNEPLSDSSTMDLPINVAAADPKSDHNLCTFSLILPFLTAKLKKPVLIGHLFSTRMFSFLRMADEFNLMPFDPWPQKCDLFWVTSTFCPFYFNISSTVTDIKPKNSYICR